MTEKIDLNLAVRQLLATIKDPETGRPLSKQIHDVQADGNSIDVKIGLTSFAWPLKDDFQKEIESVLKNQFSDCDKITVDVVAHQRPAQPIGQVGLTTKAVIASGLRSLVGTGSLIHRAKKPGPSSVPACRSQSSSPEHQDRSTRFE